MYSNSIWTIVATLCEIVVTSEQTFSSAHDLHHPHCDMFTTARRIKTSDYILHRRASDELEAQNEASDHLISTSFQIITNAED